MGNYQILKGMQKSAAEDDYIVFHFYRKISIFFTLLFIKLRFSANFITFLSMVSDFVAIFAMFSGHWIWAGVCIQLAIVFDNSDGEVARFWRYKGKVTKQTKYGEYLDEILGFVGFSLVILFAGYFMGYLWVGVFGMFGLLINMGSSFCAINLFKENKKQIAKDFEQGIFGKIKGRVGFSNGAQRILVTLAIIFTSYYLLLLFGVLINLFWIIKLWLYRGQ